MPLLSRTFPRRLFVAPPSLLQIKEECFLEDINNVLQSGEVPNLYGKDEIGQVLDGVRKAAKKAGVDENTEALWAFFVDR